MIIKKEKKLSFDNNGPFRLCITRINNIFTDNAEDLDIAMPIYNLLEYIVTIIIMTSKSLWNYHRVEINDDGNENNGANNRIYNNQIITRKSFEYKAK